MLRIALALLLATGLAACSSSPMDAPDSYSGYAGNGVDPRSIATATGMPRALAQLPPAAGPVVNVLEKRFTNGVIQDIILTGDAQTGGENKITVSLATRQPNNGDNTNPGTLWLNKADDRAIFQEISDQFPDVNMTMSQVVDRNVQGPFGYALGKRGSITCILAWQWIEDRSGLNAFFVDLSASDRPAVTVRVRLCKSGVTEQTLAGYVRQLVVNPGGYGGGYGGGYAAAMPAYGARQAPHAGMDALTVAAGGGPGYAVGYRPQAGYGAAVQPTVLYASPAQYRATKVHRVAPSRPRHVLRRYVAVRHSVRRHHARYRAPMQDQYSGQTAGLQPVYAPAPMAQVPRYIPAPANRLPGAPGGAYVAVPLPE